MCVYTPCLTTCVQLYTPSFLSTVCPVLSSLSSPFLNLHLHVMYSFSSSPLRELSKMRKENRKKEHLIKSLQADARKKEVILKRKQDEVISILSTSRATQHVWSLTLASPERVA